MRTLLVWIACALAATAFADETARPAPAFNMLRVNQPSLSLNQYRGKVVALAFILTSCGHCQQFTIELNQIAKEYTNRGVQFLECAFNDDAAQGMPEFLGRFTPPYPVTFSSPAAVRAFFQRTIYDQRPFRVPYLVLIDRAGIIRGDFPGESDLFQNPGPNLRKELDKLLGEPRKQ